MESKTGWSVIFNIISYLILCGFIALGVLALLEYIDSGSYLNIKIYGTAGALVVFIAMRIILNIDKNVRITADNTYDMLVLIERYVKASNINTEVLSKKDLKIVTKKDKIVKKMEEKRDMLSDLVIDEETPVAESKAKGKPKAAAPLAVPASALGDKYTLEDWKKNLEGRVVCKQCNSPIIVLNSNVGIPVLYCSKAAAKGECDNKYITANNFAAQFIKWYNLAYDKRAKEFDFEEFNRTVGKVILNDGTAIFSGKDAISYAPNGNTKKKKSLDL